jgi:hypothetical protein
MSKYVPAAALAAVVCGSLVTTAPAAETVLTSSGDNTLYESKTGALSNGAGEWFFAGRTNQGKIRRGLIRFDLSGIPANATISAVSLRLSHNFGQPATFDVALHRVLAGWGEGASDAINNEGNGIEAAPGDATWLHTEFDTALWTTPGGDFAPEASATTPVGPDFTDYTWSDVGMVADVQAWVSGTAANHGWLLHGDEVVRFGSAKRFATHENLDEALRPQLTITWSVVGDLDGDNVVGAADLAILLGQWSGPGTADFDGDGTVGAPDLGILLGGWSS